MRALRPGARPAGAKHASRLRRGLLLGHRRPGDPRPWRGRFLLYAAGIGFVALGLKGILHNTFGFEHPSYWARLLVGGTLAHDLLVAPIGFVVAVAVRRLLSDSQRAYVAGGLVVSGIVTAIAWPGLRGYGDKPDNPSVDPLNYAHGLLVTLGVVWAGVGALAARRLVLDRRARRLA